MVLTKHLATDCSGPWLLAVTVGMCLVSLGLELGRLLQQPMGPDPLDPEKAKPQMFQDSAAIATVPSSCLQIFKNMLSLLGAKSDVS